MSTTTSTGAIRGPIRLAAVCSVLFGSFAATAFGEPIDPNKFASLGVLSGAAGAYALNTGNGTTTPTLAEPGGTTLDGVIFTQPSGGAVAVFDFNSLTINPNMVFTITGSIPLVLLSRGDATIDSGLNVSGGDGAAGAGPGVNIEGAGGPGGFGGAAGFGVGGFSAFGGGGGGGFGGLGGVGGPGLFGGGGGGGPGDAGGGGGSTYGDLGTTLQGGSGGGLTSGGGGGGGGGAIEIGALGTLNIGGSGILANGGGAGGGGGGGGSGGGVFLFAHQINLTGALSAQGGAGAIGQVGGGGGGGGRILIETGPGGFHAQGPVTAAGGVGGPTAQAGQYGTVDVLPMPFDPIGPTVPEPSSVVLMTLGLAGAAGWNRRSRRIATSSRPIYETSQTT